MDNICKCGKKLNFRNSWQATCRGCGRRWGHSSSGKLWQMSRPTKHAPDAVESAASVSISPTSEVSALQADSTPATTQVM